MLWAHLLGTPRPPCQRKLTWIEKPSHRSWTQTLAYQAANCNLTNPGKTGKNCSINPKSHWEIISYFKPLGGLFQGSLLYNNSQPIQHSSWWWLIQRTTSTNFVVPKDPKESLGQKACTLGFLLRDREFWLFHQDVGFTWLFLCKWQWEHFLFPDSVSFIFILSLSSPLLWTQIPPSNMADRGWGSGTNSICWHNHGMNTWDDAILWADSGTLFFFSNPNLPLLVW